MDDGGSFGVDDGGSFGVDDGAVDPCAGSGVDSAPFQGRS